MRTAWLAFVTNRSFLDSRTFDGFRKTVATEFAEIRVVDLGGDVRANPKLSGTKHNVFGIQTGVAIAFFVKKPQKTKDHRCRIYYTRRPELETADEKLAWLGKSHLAQLSSEEVRPDKKHNWLNLTANDFEELLPVASKETKLAKREKDERAIFRLFSLGVVTNRDEWAYAESDSELLDRIGYLIDVYESHRGQASTQTAPFDHGIEIKWTRAVKNDLARNVPYCVDAGAPTESYYRPFVKRRLYFSRRLNEMVYQVPQLFGRDAGPNRAFGFVAEDRAHFSVIAFDTVPNKDLFMPSAAQVLAEYRYENGERLDNITDWALKQFTQHYKAGPGKRLTAPSKEGIFHYVYAVLHDPVYREKYALNLKRDFPRIPLHGSTRADFWRWAAWGEALMALHIGYETVAPHDLQRIDTPDTKARTHQGEHYAPKPVLRSEPEAGRILIDSETTLTGIPPEAWTYRLGNRSAIDWVLDQHKEKKPKDPTIREKFDTYRLKDHKKRVIDLLGRVVAVSVATVRIVEEIADAQR